VTAFDGRHRGNRPRITQWRGPVERILREHGDPPDEQEKATQAVLEQAEALSAEWAAAWRGVPPSVAPAGALAPPTMLNVGSHVSKAFSI
jgi:hypothetical protein